MMVSAAVSGALAFLSWLKVSGAIVNAPQIPSKIHLDFLLPCLECIGSAKLVSLTDEQQAKMNIVGEAAGPTFAGSDLRDKMLEMIASIKWQPRLATPLAVFLRDVSMGPKLLELILKKMILQFASLDVQELPALIYQLLLLSKKVQRK